jgi:hypothetical protein
VADLMASKVWLRRKVSRDGEEGERFLPRNKRKGDEIREKGFGQNEQNLRNVFEP